MKFRSGFVSNSSSTSFIITNHTKEKKTIVDFVKENPQLVDEFNSQYGCAHTYQELLDSAVIDNTILRSGDNGVEFGDEDGTIIGKVFDYILRYGGSSKSFSWHFSEYNR